MTASQLPLDLAPPARCGWCTSPAVGAVEGIDHCAEHHARALARAAFERVAAKQAASAIDRGAK